MGFVSTVRLKADKPNFVTTVRIRFLRKQTKRALTSTINTPLQIFYTRLTEHVSRVLCHTTAAALRRKGTSELLLPKSKLKLSVTAPQNDLVRAKQI